MTANRQLELLRASLFALNEYGNRGLNHPDFKDTYALAKAIGDYLSRAAQPDTQER